MQQIPTVASGGAQLTGDLLTSDLFTNLVGRVGDTFVPGFFVAQTGDCGGLTPLSAATPTIRTPADDGIVAQGGDETSAPNAVSALRLNRIICVASANVGYSAAAQDTKITPSALSYDVQVHDGPRGGYAMTFRLLLEYSSTFPQEGMVVWLKKKQQLINGEDGASELLLVETGFEDWANGQWVPVRTDVRYTAEADSVVQAVITTNSGQTAGRMKTEGAVEDAKLGPVGERGRIVLTYLCEELYSYPEMVLENSGETRARMLVPIGLQLPWSPFDSPAADCAFKSCVRGPKGSATLDAKQNILAFRDLQRSLVLSSLSTSEFAARQVVLLPEASQSHDGELVWQFSRSTLPPVPAMLLVWLSIPDPSAEFEEVSLAVPAVTRTTLLYPREDDSALLRASLPGGQTGHLFRCRVETAAPQRLPSSTRIHADITISDASGSTGMHLHTNSANLLQSGNQETVRTRFNKHEERRALMRLQAVPKLRTAGVLMPGDIWRQIMIVFNHAVKEEFGLECSVDELDAETVEGLLSALCVVDTSASENGAAARRLREQGKGVLLDKWSNYLRKVRDIRPGGGTSFVEAASHARKVCVETACLGSETSAQQILSGRGEIARTAYVNFDTDGGNNCGPCYDAIQKLVDETEIVQGHVLGVGSWVDQDCASKVAKILKGSTSLSLHFPENAAADQHFRQDLSRWIKVLRSCPVTLRISAGAVDWRARRGLRSENAVECLLAMGGGTRFDVPDVSDDTFTKARLTGLQAGETATIYMMSRVPIVDLNQRLSVEIGDSSDRQRAVVYTTPEPMSGIALGHHWLSILARSVAGSGNTTADAVAVNRATLCTRLRERIEDDLSFAWDLPTKSGSTAAVGRARTENRPKVSLDQQPKEPTLTVPAKPELHCLNFGGFGGASTGGGLFGGGPVAGASSALFGGAPVAGASSAFGAANCGGGLGGVRDLGGGPAMGGGGLMGGFCGGGGGSRSLSQNSGGGCSQSLFGSPMAMASPPPPPQASLFGASQLAPPQPRGLFGNASGHAPAQSTVAAAPLELLEESSFMCVGPRDISAARALASLRYTASISCTPTPPKPGSTEDPLVATLLGPATATSKGSEDVTTMQWDGFTCDNCKACPIVGVRFKATSEVDHDLCASCRIAGRLAGAAGYRRLANTEAAMRSALQAVLDWWPLHWGPEHAALFGHQGKQPRLASMSLPVLRSAVSKLPDL
eukprot:TRINITY_DN19304_c0_g1_i1.p1 TRINITY_DN19304_c0_g1~~TRINITY_DN19304_c0_g1_i1.p1  ORF type:complete len:1214 (+),score=171.00 TRINITY_DN19304_c0_g1_i1:87-3728(+)